jgi:hypothetical protein
MDWRDDQSLASSMACRSYTNGIAIRDEPDLLGDQYHGCWACDWLVVAAALFLLPAWESDNSLTLSYAPTMKQPNLSTNKSNHGADIGGFRTFIAHRDTWQYGSNYLLFGFSKDNAHDPKRGSPDIGATQFFGGYRGLLSGNALVGQPVFSNPIVSDLRLSVGVEFNDKNSTLANKKKQALIGINIKFNVPEPARLSLGIHYSREWNYNAIVGKSVIYQGGMQAEWLYVQPLPVWLPIRYEFNGSVTSPKGHDGFGRQTVTEVFTQQRLIVDLGDLIWHQPKRLDGYVGFQYWYAKMGGNPHIKSGSVEQTAIFGTTLHF